MVIRSTTCTTMPTLTLLHRLPLSPPASLLTQGQLDLSQCHLHNSAHREHLMQAAPLSPPVNAGLPTQGYSAVVRHAAGAWGLHHRQHYGTATGAGCCLCGVNLATNLCPAPWIPSDSAPAGRTMLRSPWSRAATCSWMRGTVAGTIAARHGGSEEEESYPALRVRQPQPAEFSKEPACQGGTNTLWRRGRCT